MKNARTIAIASGLTLVALLTACRTPELRETGYLSDYSKLAQLDKNRLIYLNPRVEPGTYTGFIVEKVGVNLGEDREGAFTDEELEELAEHFYSEITKRIAQKERVVTRPAPGVARFRIALTDVETSNALLNILPQTRLIGVGRGGAAFEGEILDSQTGEQILAVVRRAKPGVFEGSGLGKMSDAKTAINEWCDNTGANIARWRAGEGAKAFE